MKDFFTNLFAKIKKAQRALQRGTVAILCMFRRIGSNQSSDEIHVGADANTMFNPLKFKKRSLKILKKTICYGGILLCLLVLFTFTFFTSVGCEKKDPLDLNRITDSTTYYIVGYDACSVGNSTNDSGEYKTGGYLIVSENLADTLVAYNLPNGMFDFQEEIMPGDIFGFNFFPQEYRFTYPMQMTYRTATEEEIQNVVKPCLTYYPVLYNIEPTYIVITSISKINISHENN
jgi:hypothetical protein